MSPAAAASAAVAARARTPQPRGSTASFLTTAHDVEASNENTPIHRSPMSSTGTPSHTQHHEPYGTDSPMTELNADHARRAIVEHTRRLGESAAAAGPD